MDKIELIQSMIAQDQTNASAWYLLGLEYSEQGVHDQALHAFSEALKYGGDEIKDKIFLELGKLSGKNQEAPSQAGMEDRNFFEESGLDSPEESDSAEEEEATDMEQESALDNLIPLRVIEGKRSMKNNPVDSEVPVIDFNDVGGLDNLKDIIKMKIVKPFINPGLFDKFKKKAGGGILLFGPPGCGKTYIARATAGECNARFIPVHITDILDPYLGVSEQNIKDIFSVARAKKPSILFFDEIDTIGYNRSKLSSEHMRPVVDQLLAEIEGIDSSTDKLLIIGATNMPWDVDSALKRPGRFDKTVFVPPPDEAARAAIFQLKLAGRPSEAIDYGILAKGTELYSGADIENVVEVATENVINEILKTGTERPIVMKDLIDAVADTKPSTIDWIRTIKNYVKYANQAGQYDEVEKFLSRHKKVLG